MLFRSWKARDRLERYRRWLTTAGAADDAFVHAVDAEAKEFAARMRVGVIASGPRPVEELFEWVFADLPPHLARQRDDLFRFAPDATTEQPDG